MQACSDIYIETERYAISRVRKSSGLKPFLVKDFFLIKGCSNLKKINAKF